MVYRSFQAPKTGYYNSWQGHANPEISDLSSLNRFFSSRPFKARIKEGFLKVIVWQELDFAPS